MYEPPSKYDIEEPFQTVSFSHIFGILICYLAIIIGCVLLLLIEYFINTNKKV